MEGTKHTRSPAPSLPTDGQLFQELLAQAPVAMQYIDAAGNVFWANQAQLDLLGYGWEEYAGRSLADFYASVTDGRRTLDALGDGRMLREHDAVWRHKDGSVRIVLLSAVSCGADSRFASTCCFAQDVTEQKRVERRLFAENAVVRALAEAVTLRDATPRVLEAVGRSTRWSWAAMWAVETGEEPVLRCVEFWHRPERRLPDFEAAARRQCMPRGSGLPGAVWATGSAAWVADISGGVGDPSLHVPGATDEVHAALVCPVPGKDGGILGVMGFFSRHLREPDPDLLEVVCAIGRQVGQYIERHRNEHALAASEARNAAVIRASLDCVVSIDHRGRVLEWNPAAEETFGFAHGEAVGREMAEMIIPPRLRQQHRLALARYQLTGEGYMVGRRVETCATRKGGQEFPVEVTITRINGAGPPTFTGHLRDLSERRAAEHTSASLRAVLQELLVARDIQESVLPKQVPRLPGIEVAGMVRAAAQCSGDFYDYLTTPDGRTIFVVGDASGHGVGPALVASETATCLRTLVRTYGRVDHLLTEANAILAEATPSATFVTMILVGIDPDSRILTYANAGHPSGLVIGPDGRVKAELESMDLPLAVSRDVVFEQGGPMPLATGDLVVLVSDGLLEAWSPQGVAFGRDRLREAACALQPQPAHVIVGQLYETVRAFTCWASQHDDMSIIAIKVGDD